MNHPALISIREKNEKIKNLLFVVRNESSIYAVIVINKIHNKGARLKHNRIEWSKLEPEYFSHHFENEDSVPPLLDSNESHFDREIHNTIENKAESSLNIGEKELTCNTSSSQTILSK